MCSYVIVKFFNYRKDVSFDILEVHNNQSLAIERAYKLAISAFGKNAKIVDISEECVEEHVYVGNVIEWYTTENGYDRDVFAVVEVPENKSDKSDKSDESDKSHESE